MNFGGKSKIKPVKAVIRTVRVQEPKKPEPRPSAVRQQSRSQNIRDTESPARASPSTARSSPSTPSLETVDLSRLQAPKSKSRRLSPAARIDWGSDGDDLDDSNTDFEEPSRKKQKLDQVVDIKRRLRQKQAFSEQDGGVFDMIHAADISSSASATEVVTVELKYPSASQKER
jgi:H3 lysine-79-specific histone-lysine N-methyltransferase